MMNDENYARLLAVVTVLEHAVIEIGLSLPLERRQALSVKMKELAGTITDADGPYGSSFEATTNRVARGLSGLS